jgi:hypothetical protein
MIVLISTSAVDAASGKPAKRKAYDVVKRRTKKPVRASKVALDDADHGAKVKEAKAKYSAKVKAINDKLHDLEKQMLTLRGDKKKLRAERLAEFGEKVDSNLNRGEWRDEARLKKAARSHAAKQGVNPDWDS